MCMLRSSSARRRLGLAAVVLVILGSVLFGARLFGPSAAFNRKVAYMRLVAQNDGTSYGGQDITVAKRLADLSEERQIQLFPLYQAAEHDQLLQNSYAYIMLVAQNWQYLTYAKKMRNRLNPSMSFTFGGVYCNLKSQISCLVEIIEMKCARYSKHVETIIQNSSLEPGM